MKPRDIERLDYATAARFLAYDPETGVFRWREARRYAVKAGDIAGALGRDGYWTIFIDGCAYKGHRLAWLLVNGVWPKAEIDHINQVRNDNRIANLREATHGENQVNSRIYRNNKSGFRGVHFHKGTQKYVAEIKRDGKTRHLGVFATAEEACARFLAEDAR